MCYTVAYNEFFPSTTFLPKAKKLKGWLGMMWSGDRVGRSMDFPSVCPSVTQCALQRTRERCTVIQREKISSLISTFLPIEAMRRAAQKFIKLIGGHEPRAWCSAK